MPFEPVGDSFRPAELLGNCNVRIVQFARGFGPAGGVSGIAFELARGLSALGVETHSVCAKFSGSVAGVAVQRLRAQLASLEDRGPLIRRLVLPLSTFQFTFAGSLAARSWERPDTVVISHSEVIGADIVVMHTVHEEALAQSWREGRRAFLFNPLHYWLLLRNRFLLGSTRPRRVVVYGQRLRDELRRWHPILERRIRYIPNGVNVERFRPPSQGQKAAARAAIGVPVSARVVCFAGYEFGRKGLDVLLSGVARARADWHVVVVGSDAAGPFEDFARKIGIQDRVRFLGRRLDIEHVYWAADVFALPSRYESFALVCMEAMACGLPVVATPVGGVEDYLQDGENGFLVAREADAVAAGIARCLVSEEELVRLGRNARTTALRHTWERVARQYADMAAEVLDEKRNGGPA